jgi:hypothetical protein
MPGQVERGHRVAALLLLVGTCLFSGPGCGKSGESEAEFAFIVLEKSHDTEQASSLIRLSGKVVTEDGLPFAGVTVTVNGWGDAELASGVSTSSDPDGVFEIAGLQRRSILLVVASPGSYDEVIAVDLERPLSESATDIGEIILVRRRPNTVRLIFCGDSMFGRRFVDRDEDGVEGEPEDLIHAATRSENAKALLEYLRPVLSRADYTQINLETPVSIDPTEIHPYKEFKFHSHPETLVALTHAGIDAVSLGNNHVYDLLESGMSETLDHVEAAGLEWFGAGMSETHARASMLARSVESLDLAFQGFNGIIPLEFEPPGPVPWPDEYLYVAMDTPIVKGGALALGEENVLDFLNRAEERFAIPVFHGGFEYGEYPSKNMRALAASAIRNGAGVVVCHHPHTLYGVATLPGMNPPVIAFLSLGNLVFDQDVFETFQSVIAVVDVETSGPDDHRVVRARLIPFHIEGYIPKLIAGDWAARVGRHVGHISTHLPAAANVGDPEDGLVGCVVFPSHNRIAICTDPSQYTTSEALEALTVPLANGSSEPMEFTRRDGADMLAGVRTLGPARIEYGRELMLYGDFEDLDVDDTYHEGDLWNQSSARFVQNSAARRGNGGFVLLRRAGDDGFAATWLKNRVTIRAGTSHTVTGFWKGENAGRIELLARWYVRDEREVIATFVILEEPGGTFDWTRFIVDIVAPPAAGTLRIYFRHYPPATGEAALLLDDVAVIEWEGEANGAGDEVELRTPNDWSWLRFHADDAATEKVSVEIRHRSYRLVPAGF